MTTPLTKLEEYIMKYYPSVKDSQMYVWVEEWRRGCGKNFPWFLAVLNNIIYKHSMVFK